MAQDGKRFQSDIAFDETGEIAVSEGFCVSWCRHIHSLHTCGRSTVLFLALETRGNPEIHMYDVDIGLSLQPTLNIAGIINRVQANRDTCAFYVALERLPLPPRSCRFGANTQTSKCKHPSLPRPRFHPRSDELFQLVHRGLDGLQHAHRCLGRREGSDGHVPIGACTLRLLSRLPLRRTGMPLT